MSWPSIILLNLTTAVASGCSYEFSASQVDKHEDNRRKKRLDIVENFKRLFLGVFDRLINISNQIHKKHSEAILVDTEQTAMQSIQYLRDQILELETFLPLDYIQAKPLKERLRNISNPLGVQLL